ncbi:MAG: DUF1501 domain-containing protein [Deltaproteobacteria bacterium]|nr:DUF1501 domain-containing protein [Deltaproteobacteria bacterium]
MHFWKRTARPEGFSVARRRLLGGAAGAVGSAAVGMLGFESLARADVPLPAGRAFLFCYFPGGWDQLLLLDPRDPARFPDADRSRTLIEPRYRALEGHRGYGSQLLRPRGSSPHVFGPGAARAGDGRSLLDYADRMAVLRGVNMAALGHEVAYRYFLTSAFPVGTTARGSSVAVDLVAQMLPRLPRRPLPNLAIQVESYNDRHPGAASAVQVSGLEDFLLVMAPSGRREEDVVERALADRGATASPCDTEAYDRRGLLTQLRASRRTADELVREDIARHFQFATADTEGAREVRARYRLERGDTSSPGARAALAVQALKLGISQVVSVSIGAVTDTHFVGNAAHMDLLQPGLSAFVALLDDLSASRHPEGGSFLDHTTVVAFSEFARAPLFNPFDGRDHHQPSSLMLLGAGIRPNVVVGATSDIGMAAVRWDIDRNVASEDGEVLQPEHVAATLLASAGLDTSSFRQRPLRAVLSDRAP